MNQDLHIWEKKIQLLLYVRNQMNCNILISKKMLSSRTQISSVTSSAPSFERSSTVSLPLLQLTGHVTTFPDCVSAFNFYTFAKKNENLCDCRSYRRHL